MNRYIDTSGVAQEGGIYRLGKVSLHFKDISQLIHFTEDEALWKAGGTEFIFAHAFDWSTTPEGRDFWRDIDRNWYTLINS